MIQGVFETLDRVGRDPSQVKKNKSFSHLQGNLSPLPLNSNLGCVSSVSAGQSQPVKVMQR